MVQTAAKILIVDDSRSIRAFVSASLFQGGFKNTDEASDGEQAWLKINAANPPFDLVISDWHMPNLSGMGLLQKIRAGAKTKSLAVIMSTSEIKKEEIVKCVQLGVTAYLAKPYEPAALLSTVQKALAKFAETK
jgi:two-component system chemotaxis response regulator CheY